MADESFGGWTRKEALLTLSLLFECPVWGRVNPSRLLELGELVGKVRHEALRIPSATLVGGIGTHVTVHAGELSRVWSVTTLLPRALGSRRP